MAKKPDSDRLDRLERDVKINRIAGICVIIGLPVAICALAVGLVGIKEIHDWLFYKVFHAYSAEQSNPAVSPTPSPNAIDESAHAHGAPAPQFTDHDPQTGALYQKVISFDKFDHVNPNKVRGGDSKTPGREVIIEWTAPGPVTSVTGKCLVGWCEIESCNYHEDIAHCEGWTNDGNRGTINMTVHWVQRVPTP
jgi:hypothetical protein